MIAVKQRYTDKYFRASKIIDRWEDLEFKFINMMDVETKTKNSQCAFICLLMMETGIRVGNENSAEGYICINEYSKNYSKRVKTFGATTLLREHIWLDNNLVYLSFTGKKQVKQSFKINNDLLAFDFMTMLSGKKKGEKIFNVTPYELTKFVKRYIGRQFTPKDIRVAKINKMMLPLIKLSKHLAINKKGDINRTVGISIKAVAEHIGHTSAVCKRNYISPNLIKVWKEDLLKQLKEGKKK